RRPVQSPLPRARTHSRVEARSRGSWVVSGALDLLLNGYGCLDIGYQTTYDGQLVDIRGSQSWGRARAALGHTLDVGGIHSSLTVGAGLIPAMVDRARSDDTDLSWQPWYGGALTVQVPDSRIGIELELGRHRVPQRYYAENSDVVVAEIRHWEPFTRLGITFPF
ncbi:MAG: hypothetical protein PVF69_05750, partial [Gemmatimonadota bacterium]